MNRKVLLGVVVALTLITAGIHLVLGGGMAFGPRPGGPGGGNRPPADNGGQAPDGGQPPDGGQGNGGGGGNGQGNGGGGGNGQGNGGGGGGGQRQGGGPGGMMMALPILFLLNGVGYLVLLALLVFKVPYFKDHAALVHWLLIGFATVTLVAYFGMNGFDGITRNVMALIAKADEVLLIIFTFLHLRAIQAPGAASTPTAAS